MQKFYTSVLRIEFLSVTLGRSSSTPDTSLVNKVMAVLEEIPKHLADNPNKLYVIFFLKNPLF